MNKQQQKELAASLGLSLEEAHYFAILAGFCEILNDVVNNDQADGRKARLLSQTLKEFLSPQAYDFLFGEKF